MGYNPYCCIICGDVKDNGWFGWSNLDYDERCDIIRSRLNLPKDYFCSNFHEESTRDVCDSCFKRGKSIRDPFFDKHHTKQERKEYWESRKK